MIPLRPTRFSVTPTPTPFALRTSRRGAGAFSLMEMLVVLAIIALLAGLALPAIRGNTESVAIKAATYQLVQDLSFARQKAISQRSTVVVVFLTDSMVGYTSVNAREQEEIDRLQGGMFTHYAIYGFRKAGEQPGRGSAGYLTEWKSLPEKTFFSTNNPLSILGVAPAPHKFPFPFSNSANEPEFPYIAFDDQGRLITLTGSRTGRGEPPGVDVRFTIARGAVFSARDNRGLIKTLEFEEIPPFNATNYVVEVDALTGRARREELGVK